MPLFLIESDLMEYLVPVRFIRNLFANQALRLTNFDKSMLLIIYLASLCTAIHLPLAIPCAKQAKCPFSGVVGLSYSIRVP